MLPFLFLAPLTRTKKRRRSKKKQERSDVIAALLLASSVIFSLWSQLFFSSSQRLARTQVVQQMVAWPQQAESIKRGRVLLEVFSSCFRCSVEASFSFQSLFKFS